MRRSLRRGHSDTMINGKERAGTRSDGTCWVLGANIRPLTVDLPQNFSGELHRSHSVYFGDRIQSSWSNLPQAPDSIVQVKLYIKVTDNEQAIPRAKWRTRMEVTLNAPPLQAVLGVRTVRDMLDADMRSLVNEYLRLYSPQPLRRARSKTCSVALSAMIDDHLRKLVQADVDAAVARGNFALVEEGMVTYAPVPDLDKSILDASGRFQRSIRRAKALRI